MNDILLLIISLAAATLCSVLRKRYAINQPQNIKTIYTFNAVTGLVSAVILLLWGGIGGLSTFTVLLGILFGIITSLQGFSNMKALECGPLSYTSVIVSLSTLITALSGALFFHETISWSQIVGIVLMLISFALAVEKKTDERKASWRWLIYCILAFLCTGGIGLMQKIHQSSAYKNELNAFLVIAFAVSFLFSITMIFCAPKMGTKAAVPSTNRSRAIIWGLMIVCGGTVAVNNKLNLYLSGVIDSAIFFPIVNGGTLVLVTLAALLVFREKLSVKQWIGIAIGMLSLLFLCNTFG